MFHLVMLAPPFQSRRCAGHPLLSGFPSSPSDEKALVDGITRGQISARIHDAAGAPCSL